MERTDIANLVVLAAVLSLAVGAAWLVARPGATQVATPDAPPAVERSASPEGPSPGPTARDGSALGRVARSVVRGRVRPSPAPSPDAAGSPRPVGAVPPAQARNASAGEALTGMPGPALSPTLAVAVAERMVCVPGASLVRNEDCPSGDCSDPGCRDGCGFMYLDLRCPCRRCSELARFLGSPDCSGEPRNTWPGLELGEGEWFSDNVGPADSLRFTGEWCPVDAGEGPAVG